MHHLINHFDALRTVYWKSFILIVLLKHKAEKQQHKLNSINKYMLYAVFPAAFSQTLICWFWPAEYLDTSVKHMKSDPVQWSVPAADGSSLLCDVIRWLWVGHWCESRFHRWSCWVVTDTNVSLLHHCFGETSEKCVDSEPEPQTWKKIHIYKLFVLCKKKKKNHN